MSQVGGPVHRTAVTAGTPSRRLSAAWICTPRRLPGNAGLHRGSPGARETGGVRQTRLEVPGRFIAKIAGTEYQFVPLGCACPKRAPTSMVSTFIFHLFCTKALAMRIPLHIAVIARRDIVQELF